MRWKLGLTPDFRIGIIVGLAIAVVLLGSARCLADEPTDLALCGLEAPHSIYECRSVTGCKSRHPDGRIVWWRSGDIVSDHAWTVSTDDGWVRISTSGLWVACVSACGCPGWDWDGVYRGGLFAPGTLLDLPSAWVVNHREGWLWWPQDR